MTHGVDERATPDLALKGVLVPSQRYLSTESATAPVLAFSDNDEEAV